MDFEAYLTALRGKTVSVIGIGVSNRPLIEKLLEKDERPAPQLVMDKSVTDFYRFTRDSFSLEGYDPQPFDDKIPVAI